MGSITTSPDPTVVFYTHHGCGWSHRVHITLSALSLPFKEVKIDLSVPRPQWFLDLNPRGVVPVLQYNDLTLTESALIVQFLLDTQNSNNPAFYPSLSDPTAASQRYRMNFIVDTYFTKVNPLMFKLLGSSDPEIINGRVEELVQNVREEIEPLLVADRKCAPGKGSFWGGREEASYVEAMMAPFIIRLYAFADDIIWPKSLVAKLDEIPTFSVWAHACMENAVVRETWHEEELLRGVHARLDDAKRKYADK